MGEKDVLLVLHSYGGIPGCGAIEGLEESVRKDIGGKGGVIGCVYCRDAASERAKSV